MQVMGLARLVTGFSVGVSALTGCSLIYNPGNLPSPTGDAADGPPPPDAPFDPDLLALSAVAPGEMFEGQGVDGSRQVVLAISGANIGRDAQVTLAPDDATSPTPMIQIDSDHVVHSQFGGMLAVPLTLPIDTANASDINLTIQISQAGSTGPIVSTLKGHLILHTLPELTKVPTAVSALAKAYSQIDLGNWTIPAQSTSQAAVVTSWSSITIGNVSADAAANLPGMGGGGGGGPGQTGAGFGGGLSPGAVAGLLSGGGGAGFATAGTQSGSILGGAANGDSYISSLNTNFASGGGGGGGLLPTANGGGGGGTIVLTAHGALTAGGLSAKGAKGDNGTTAASGGGGGAGGTVVVRSWVSAQLGAIAVDAGDGGNAGGLFSVGGGKGSVGRVRVDAPVITGVAPTPSTSVRLGVMFDPKIPVVTRNAREPINLISQVDTTTTWQVIVTDGNNATTATDHVMFETPTAVYPPMLSVGYNKICILPPGGDLKIDESTNCLAIVYVP